jgi:hypothetical protein
MYKISKDLVSDIKTLTYDELKDRFKGYDDDYFDLDKVPQEMIYEFGKLYWDDTAERIYSKGVPLFERKEVMDKLSDFAPYIVGKEGLKEAIDIYKGKVINIYKDLLVDTDEGKASDKQINHVKDYLREWESGYAINLNEESKKITHSWKYEFNMFELVRLLKTIDFEKDTILFYGW